MTAQTISYMTLGCLFNDKAKLLAVHSNITNLEKTRHGYKVEMTANGITISGVFTTKKRLFTGTVINNGKVKNYRSFTSSK